MASPFWRGGKRFVGDVKLLDPLSSNPTDIERRGAYVGLGNTEPDIMAQCFGLAQRGKEGDGHFKPSSGEGYVASRDGDYVHAILQGCDVQCLLFETFGGFNTTVTRLLARAAEQVKNKLSHSQHLDEASWSTRTWTSLKCQKLSIALHMACAFEIAQELSASAASRRGDGVAAA